MPDPDIGAEVVEQTAPQPDPRDIDALLVEMGFVEPDKISLRWRGKDWLIKPVSAVDPRALTQLGTLDGVLSILEDALGPAVYKKFPMPRGLAIPGTDKTELEVFLDAWSRASDEAASPGE